jgi:enterochelin esterase-like enzyme
MNSSLSQEFPLFSQVLQDTLTIKIALPEGYDPTTDQRYTSIYIQDANYFFDDAPGLLDEYLVRGEGMTKIVRSLEEEGKIPQAVLIGIGYSEEQRDRFTRENANQFYDFFKEDLIPLIESKYKVSLSGQDRVLFGYSSSGHFSTYVLFSDVSNNQMTFSKFISIAGVYYPELAVYSLEEKLFQEKGVINLFGRSLYLVIGSNDSKTRLLNEHRNFTNRLVGRGFANFNLIHEEFPEKGHYDIPEDAFKAGLIRLFSS